MPVNRSPSPLGVDAVLPLRQSTIGGSGSFQIAASDGQRYWCKALNNPQSQRVPITEQIVGRLGRLIGVAVCEVALVRLDGIAGWNFRADSVVEPGWAHGSLAVDPALETRGLAHRSEDDNARRHAGFYALHDWLLGGDPQWLQATSEDNAYYSHDHGFFLRGPAWTGAQLALLHHEASTLSPDPSGLDADELHRLADRLESLSIDELEREISTLPAGWPVSDDELDAVVALADGRRGAVAARLRCLVA